MTVDAVQLQLDVGNTRLKWRLLRLASASGRGPDAPDQVLGRGFLVRSDYPATDDLLAALVTALQAADVASVRVATVAARDVAQAIARWSLQQFRVTAEFAHVTAEAAGVRVGYDDPAMLGVDRWLAVLAASRYGGDGCLVVDCGSAVTVDLLQAGRHGGGYIVPGLRLMNRALFGDTARVKVQAQWDDTTPTVEPGRTTAAAVSGGLPLMVVGMLLEVLRRQQTGSGQPWRLLLCGGDARLLAALLPAEVDYRVVDDLVLDGLALAAVRPLDPASEV